MRTIVRAKHDANCVGITPLKLYDVIQDDDTAIRLKNDMGNIAWYGSSEFENPDTITDAKEFIAPTGEDEESDQASIWQEVISIVNRFDSDHYDPIELGKHLQKQFTLSRNKK